MWAHKQTLLRRTRVSKRILEKLAFRGPLYALGDTVSVRLRTCVEETRLNIRLQRKTTCVSECIACRDYVSALLNLDFLGCASPCHSLELVSIKTTPPITLRPFRELLFRELIWEIQINLRNVLGTPAGCPWDTQRNKQGCTGRCPSDSLLWDTGRPVGFQTLYVIFSYVLFCFRLNSPSSRKITHAVFLS